MVLLLNYKFRDWKTVFEYEKEGMLNVSEKLNSHLIFITLKLK